MVAISISNKDHVSCRNISYDDEFCENTVDASKEQDRRQKYLNGVITKRKLLGGKKQWQRIDKYSKKLSKKYNLNATRVNLMKTVKNIEKNSGKHVVSWNLTRIFQVVKIRDV